MTHKETILITGATGFIGGWVAETFHLTDAAHVRAGVRSWSSAARLGRFPIDMVKCDVLKPDEIDCALAGVDCVVHCAVGSPEITQNGTRNMLEAALRHGVQRFVHISTAEIYGLVSGDIDETHDFQYTGREYGDSKIEAEKLCWEYHERGLPVVILRPSIVYGPFSDSWSTDIARRLASGNWGIFEKRGEGLCNAIYVADLVAAVWLALHEPQAAGQAFNVNGPEAVSWNEYFQRFNAALGLPELKLRNSLGTQIQTKILGVARSSAKFALARFGGPIQNIYERYRGPRELMRAVERLLKTNPTTNDILLYQRHAVYSDHKAHEVLGYTPQYSLDEGLNLTAQWVKHLRLI